MNNLKNSNLFYESYMIQADIWRGLASCKVCVKDFFDVIIIFFKML